MSPAAPRRPSLADIATAAGVSTSAVSFALNNTGRLSPDTSARIRQVADELGYRPHPAARTLRRGVADSVAMVVRNLANPVFVDIIRGADELARAAGITLDVIDSAYAPEREADAVRRLLDRAVAGLAIAPVGGGGGRAAWRRAHPDLPLVVLYGNHGEETDAMTVGPSHQDSVALAVEHLISRGYTHLVHVVGPKGHVADGARERAFQSLCAQGGIRHDTLHTRLDIATTREAVEDFLAHHPVRVGFVMNSDFSAAGVYLAARRCGRRLGDDVGVVGHDDLATSQLLDPGLTTVALDRAAMGRAMMARLLGQATGDHVAATSLRVRASS